MPKSKPNRESRKPIVSIRFSAEARRWLTELAQAQGRSQSSVAEAALERYYEEKMKMNAKIKIRVDDCNDWVIENLAPEGSGRIEMAKDATGTVEVNGYTATLRGPARGAATRRNTSIVAVVDGDGGLVDESRFELDFS